ncbi:hypothetical protein [Leptolyngbya sp. FACHB-321]|nr:hypothetical protein [Leptolyngbya sp. FACHB-321]
MKNGVQLSFRMWICDRCQAMLAMSLAALSDLDTESGLEIKIRDDDY